MFSVERNHKSFFSIGSFKDRERCEIALYLACSLYYYMEYGRNRNNIKAKEGKASDSHSLAILITAPSYVV